MGRHHPKDEESSESSEEDKGLLSSDDDDHEAKHHGGKSSNGWIWWVGAGLMLAVVIGGAIYLYSQSSDSSSAASTSAESDSSPTATGSASASAAGTAASTSPRAGATDTASKTSPGGVSSSSSSAGATGGTPPPAVAAAATPSATFTKPNLPVFTAVVGVVDPKSTQAPLTPISTATYKWPASAPSVPSETPSGATKLHVDFKDYDSVSDSLESFLGKAGFLIGEWEVPSEPLSYAYKAENLAVVDNALQLSVPLVKEGAKSTSGAQIYTNRTDIGYGYIVTRARLSPVAGIRQTVVYTSSEYSGIEVGMRSSYYGSTQGVRGVTPGVALTVQSDESAGMYFSDYKDDPSDAFHDYAVYWTPGLVQLFIDKEECKAIEGNVPDTVGSVHWGAWSNGAPPWSAGPPSDKATYQIEWIDGWWL